MGESISANFTGEAWLQPLSSGAEYDCSLYNVTFAPGTRNNRHSHAVGENSAEWGDPLTGEEYNVAVKLSFKHPVF